MYNFLCSDSLLYTSFFFFLLYMVFVHMIVHVSAHSCISVEVNFICFSTYIYDIELFEHMKLIVLDILKSNRVPVHEVSRQDACLIMSTRACMCANNPFCYIVNHFHCYL